MKVPSTQFLDNIEQLYSVNYPHSYRKFCAKFHQGGLQGITHASRNTKFITDVEEFWSVNVKVGSEQWNDYERAISGVQHPKDKNTLWGGILPFCANNDEQCVFGFDVRADSSDRVHVWSVHTTVHIYSSFSDFFAEYLIGNKYENELN